MKNVKIKHNGKTISSWAHSTAPFLTVSTLIFIRVPQKWLRIQIITSQKPGNIFIMEIAAASWV